MATVSVIIPYYNRIPWVSESIQSVLTQTFQDFEIIVVDDGSIERLSDELLASDSRIKYVVQENKGPAAARNLGISLAVGKYIAFLDSDDLFLPRKLEIQVKHMEENPEIWMSHTSYSKIEENGQFLEDVESGLFSGHVYPEIILGCPIATPTVMIRRDVLSNFNFRNDIRVGEDIILWTQIAKESTVKGINVPLTKVRFHRSNTASDPMAQFMGNKKILKVALANDSKLSVIFRLKGLSSIYLYVSYMCRSSSRPIEGFWLMVIGLIYWPPNIVTLFIRMVKRLIISALPPKLRPKVIGMWKSVRKK